MGNGFLTNEKKLTVGTLNYSGICNSPFEFYSSSTDEDESSLSKIFKKNL